jgi:hypothetical protein
MALRMTLSSMRFSLPQSPNHPPWAIMILGFAGFGIIAYRRKFKPTFLTA